MGLNETVRAVAILSALLAGGRAFADPESPATRELARVHFKSARIHLDAREYDAAASEFEAALRTGREPGVFFWLGEALRLKGDKRGALAAYEEFLTRVSDAPAKINADARSHLAELRLQLPSGEASSPGETLYSSGLTHLNLGEYREAIVNLTEAYRMLHQPRLLFDIAQCHRLLGEPERAAQFYRNFLQETGDPANRADAERLLGEVEKEGRAKLPSVAAQPAGTVLSPPVLSPPVQETKLTVIDSAPAPALAAVKKVESPAPIKKDFMPAETRTSTPTASHRSRAWVWAAIGGGAAILVGGAIGLAIGLGNAGGPPSSTYGSFTTMFR